MVERLWSKRVCQLGLCIKCTKLDGKVVKVVVIRVFFGVLGFLIRVSSGIGLGSYLGFHV